jgi:DNA replication protein DnaC
MNQEENQVEPISSVASTILKSTAPTGQSNSVISPIQNCQPDCPICHGSGWVKYDLPIYDPNFGKLFPCVNAANNMYGRLSGLQDRELNLTWDAIKNVDPESNIAIAAAAVREVIQDGRGWVFLWGSPGLAKTLILQIAVAETIRSGREASYTRMVEIIDNMRRAFDSSRPGEEEERRIERWSNMPLLCIDEFDRINGTEYASNRQFLVMDKRYMEAIRGNAITIMSSNADPRSFDGYLSSRIHDGRFKVIHLIGSDFRPDMGWWDD